MAGASTQYLIRSPEKGFSPIKTPESIQFDDLEQSSYLSAKTRLGEPSKRIVLLEEKAFRRLAEKAKREGGLRVLEALSREEEKMLLKQSVSVREKRISRKTSQERVIYGRKRLEGLEIFSAEIDGSGTMYYNDLKEILELDRELGVLFRER